jgi:hypothetical protein
MRGMGRSGGGVAGPRFSGAPAGRFSSGFRPAPGMAGRTFGAPQGRVFVRPGGTVRGFGARVVASGRTVRSFSFRRFRHDAFFSHDCFVFPCRNRFLFGDSLFFGFGSPFFGNAFFPGFFGASYIPGFSYPYDYSTPPPAEPVVVQGDNAADTQLAMEVQRLSDEIADMRDEQAVQRMRERPAPPPGTSMSVVNPAASTTFVFRDGRRVTAQNYAITGETLWVLNEHSAKKFALADLDRAATEQVNASSGVDLHLPEPPKH